MHFPKIYIILGLLTISAAAIYVLLLSLGLSLNRQNKTRITSSPTLSIPIVYRVPSITTQPSQVIPSDKKTYVDPNNRFSFRYPSDWTVVPNTNPQDTTQRFAFVVEGKEYSFQILQRGSISLQAATTQADTLTEKGELFQGRQFLIRIWSTNGKPFLIMAFPNEADFDIPAFLMDLPGINPEKYQAQFENLLANMHISSPSLLTPAPTLITPQTYHLK